ncbi:MAG TPA: right-handed parallel beta-helix repeat-containing protein [Bacteroidales bacterium]|nr:right-handed parallel beta-helix repeat-containing protein [Bacteroidales bacterium]
MRKKEILIIIISLLVLAGLYWAYTSIIKKNEEIQKFSLFCDFETQNDSAYFITDNKNYLIGPGMLSNEIFYDGKQSLHIPPWEVYHGLIILDNLQPNANVIISFKRYNSSKAGIVAQGVNPASFYFISNEAAHVYENGWEDVYLNFTCGRDFKDTLNIYIFNTEKKDTYIDNLSITVSNKVFYPKYGNEEPLLIYIEDKEFATIINKRDEALDKGVLITEDDSWVNAVVYGEGRMMRAEVRLKGDWLDHLRGEKWSFRIKLKDDSWRGMRVFSIQHPNVRGFLNEWLLHKICKEVDILTTRYGFVPVYLNGNSIGLYAYEEHFQKEMIESSNRREGQIIKYSEVDFWNLMYRNIPNRFVYLTSVIEPFGADKILEDSLKYKQFLIAANLLDMYRNMSAKASDIFDVKKMAKFIALVNSYNTFHALEWHNVRYYYNPVLCRIEPIAFDMFSGMHAYNVPNPISIMLEEDSEYKVSYCINYLKTDSIFEKEYFKYLEIFTNELSYKFFRKKFNKQYTYLDSINRLEFIPYYFDTVQFSQVPLKIKFYLPIFLDSLNDVNYRNRYNALKDKPLYVKEMYEPLKYADKYLKAYKQSAKTILFKCFLQFDVDIVGLGDDKSIKSETLKTIKNKDSGIVSITEINFENDLNQFSHVYFKVQGQDSVFKTNIVQWPAPTTYNPRNDIASKATDISKYTNIETREIRFSGNLTFDNHIYIKEGYTVIFDAGTNMNITNNAAFISNSTILIKGTKDKPVKIYSSDKSANGFTVLQAEDLSVCNYVTFDNLNTLNYNGWTLTGAVTFYESDVKFLNCTFSNNHCEDMLNTIRCDFLVKDCLIKNTFGDSHDSDFCTGTLDNCTFINNGNDAIDFSTSDVIIKNCKINGAGDKGISVGENTKAIINNVIIDNVNIGIASKDLSHAEVNNLKINNATYGFLLLQKKPEFGPATITAKNCELKDVWTESLIEQNSILVLNGTSFKGKKPKLKALFYE